MTNPVAPQNAAFPTYKAPRVHHALGGAARRAGRGRAQHVSTSADRFLASPVDLVASSTASGLRDLGQSKGHRFIEWRGRKGRPITKLAGELVTHDVMYFAPSSTSLNARQSPRRFRLCSPSMPTPSPRACGKSRAPWRKHTGLSMLLRSFRQGLEMIKEAIRT